MSSSKAVELPKNFTQSRLWAPVCIMSVIGGAVLGLQGMAAAAIAVVFFHIASLQFGHESADKHGISETSASRFGGVIVLVFILAFAAGGFFGRTLTLDPLAAVYLATIFAIGFFEDIHGLLRANVRLVLMLGATAIYVWAKPNTLLQGASVGIISEILRSHWLVAAAVSVLGLAFLINAFNTADGANGLLGTTCVFALLSILVFHQPEYGKAIQVVIIGLGIFLLFNLALGNVFLGDGGAYFLGALVGLALIDASNSGADLWWLLCLVFYPHADLLFSMARRIKAGQTPFGADNEHLHNLLFGLVRPYFTHGKHANSATGLAIGCGYGASALVLTSVFPYFDSWGWVYLIMWVSYVSVWLVLKSQQERVI